MITCRNLSSVTSCTYNKNIFNSKIKLFQHINKKANYKSDKDKHFNIFIIRSNVPRDQDTLKINSYLIEMAQGVADPANPLLAPAVGLTMPFSRAPSLNMNLDF